MKKKTKKTNKKSKAGKTTKAKPSRAKASKPKTKVAAKKKKTVKSKAKKVAKKRKVVSKVSNISKGRKMTTRTPVASTASKVARRVLGRGLSSLISSGSNLAEEPLAAQQPAHLPRPAPVPNPTPVSLPVESIPSETQAQRESAANAPEPSFKAQMIEISQIQNNPAQPRKEFTEPELLELAESIKAYGIIQPIIVRRPHGSESFQIVAGERRWRAAQLCGLKHLPAIVENYADREAFEIAIIENIQRKDLNAVEEALAYKRLMDEFSLTQKEVATRVGKDRASIANSIRLLSLPDQVLSMLRDGQLSSGHAKAILTVKEPSAQISLAKKSVGEQLSVRALEQIVSRVVVLDGSSRKPKLQAANSKPSNGDINTFPDLVERLRRALGTKVSIRHHDSGRGKVEIEYFSEQELERVVDHLSR